MNDEVREAIKEAVSAGIQAGRKQAQTEMLDAYKATERRLYAYPVLIRKIVEDKERLAEIERDGAPTRSKSITRFSKSGVRLSPDEILDALITDLSAAIAADEHEVATIGGALKTIEGDHYALAVYGKYVKGQSDDEIANTIPCDPSTVRRNRGRLVRRLAVWLYGAQAI